MRLMTGLQSAQRIRMAKNKPYLHAIERPIVVFDGGCAMCRRQMRRLTRLDWGQRFAMLEYDVAIQHYPEVARGTLGDGLRVRFPDATVTVGIDAIRSIGIRLPLTAAFAWGLYLPGIHGAADRLYRVVAKRRKTTSDSCSL